MTDHRRPVLELARRASEAADDPGLRWIAVVSGFQLHKVLPVVVPGAESAGSVAVVIAAVAAAATADAAGGLAMAPDLAAEADAVGATVVAYDPAAIDLERLGDLVGLPTSTAVAGVWTVAAFDATLDPDGAATPAPPGGVVFVDRYGTTFEHGCGDPLTLADGAGTLAEVFVAADPAAVWALATDLDLIGRFAEEPTGARWADDQRGVGAPFIGSNTNQYLGNWEIDCFVDAWQPPTSTDEDTHEPGVFGWRTSDPSDPGARWTFAVTPAAGGCWLTHRVALGPGPSGLSIAIESMPDAEGRILIGRLKELQNGMQRTVEGLRDLAEAR